VKVKVQSGRFSREVMRCLAGIDVSSAKTEVCKKIGINISAKIRRS
jgi:hypothetical protein